MRRHPRASAARAGTTARALLATLLGASLGAAPTRHVHRSGSPSAITHRRRAAQSARASSRSELSPSRRASTRSRAGRTRVRAPAGPPPSRRRSSVTWRRSMLSALGHRGRQGPPLPGAPRGRSAHGELEQRVGGGGLAAPMAAESEHIDPEEVQLYFVATPEPRTTSTRTLTPLLDPTDEQLREVFRTSAPPLPRPDVRRRARGVRALVRRRAPPAPPRRRFSRTARTRVESRDRSDMPGELTMGVRLPGRSSSPRSRGTSPSRRASSGRPTRHDSTATLAEAVHSLADTGNQALLLVGMRLAARPQTSASRSAAPASATSGRSSSRSCSSASAARSPCGGYRTSSTTPLPSSPAAPSGATEFWASRSRSRR